MQFQIYYQSKLLCLNDQKIFEHNREMGFSKLFETNILDNYYYY